MREAKLTINLIKSEFGKATVKCLGHIVGQGQVRPLDAKIQAIVKYPIPTSWKELARFLGMAGYSLNFLEIFYVYLGSTPFKIKVYTDHNPLTFLKTMKNKNQRLVRLSLALQEYNLEIQHTPGSENVVADALSRCIGLDVRTVIMDC